MRAHIEFVVADDLVWHEAELPAGAGDARQRNLSYDEENGGASTLVRFDTAWTRPAGYHAADTEWFVVDGEVSLGGRGLGPGSYWRAPSGLRVPELAVTAGTEVVLIRDGADGAFVPSEVNRSAILRSGVNSVNGSPARLTVLDGREQQWEPNPLAGKCEPDALLECVVLYRDAPPILPGEQHRGAATMLVRHPAGWRNPQYEHHSCWQELYLLSGALDYNFGALPPGGYLHRPALVKHGNARVSGDQPALALVRFGGVPEHWITEDPVATQLARPVNWDPEDPYQTPIVSGIPQRTVSTGQWNGYMK